MRIPGVLQERLPSDQAQRTAEEIKDLAQKHKKIKIILTTRPTDISQHLDQLPGFSYLQIQPLTNIDFEPFFTKIGVNPETCTRLLNAIGQSKAEIRDLLTTPLMLTLLVNSCGNRAVLPDTLSEFYEALFGVMVSTHDETKPGYVREKSSGLSNNQLESVFKSFCFISKESGTTTLSPKIFNDSFEKANRIIQYTCTSEQFKSDIINVACLMAKDGINISFIHKSIQEYFASAFIAELDDDAVSEAIYSEMRAALWRDWRQELYFLSKIDKIRCDKYYHIPSIEHVLNLFDYNENKKLGATISSITTAIRRINPTIVTREDGDTFSVPYDIARKIGEPDYFFAPFDGIPNLLGHLNIRETKLINEIRHDGKARAQIFQLIRENLKQLASKKEQMEEAVKMNRATLLSIIQKKSTLKRIRSDDFPI